MSIEERLQKILENKSPEDQKLIRSAFEYAKDAHEGQKRKNGEPYITHSLAVAEILSKLKLDASAISAGLLHDVPEDTEKSLDDIQKKFGDEISYLVNGMTKLSEVRLKGSHDPNYVENLRKMFITAAQDLRVVLIKLADRLHNMRTVEFLDDHKRQSYSEETIQVFAPLADRLGMGELKGELEDLSFKHILEEEYDKLKKQIEPIYEDKKKYIGKAIDEINTLIKNRNIKILDIHGRTKHIYSLHNKLKKYETDDLSKITDIVAVRIIAKNTMDCYSMLGIIHEQYKPLPGKIKDYISIPKPNGYQSLHTTIFGPLGEVLEIQIRTEEMHEYAEHGIAAHWSYNEAGKPKGSAIVGKKLAWVKQLHELQKGLLEDPKEFMNTLKLDLFQNRIFCFTPKGDVIDLPLGSTPIDFAFAVHSDLGYRCMGVKINKNIAKLGSTLNNGDVVEIITSKNPVKISRDWLRMVKTSKGREHVRRAIK